MNEKTNYFGGIKNILLKMQLKHIDITPNTILKKELGMDSINIADLAFRIELRYDLSIPDKELAQMNNVQDLVNFIKNQKLEKQQSDKPNMIIKKTLTILVILCAIGNTLAQKNDSIPSLSPSKIYPKLRPFILQYQQYGSSDFTTNFKGNPMSKGEGWMHHNFKAFASYPFLIKKKWIFSSTVNYEYFDFQANDIKTTNQSIPVQKKKEFSIHDVTLTLSAMYMDSLWNKPLYITNSVIFDSKNFSSVERVRFMSSAALVLKKTEQTTISAGLVLIVDKTVQIPVIPTFSYSHSFSESPWEVDLLLPSRLYFRRQSGNSGWLTVGAEISGSSYFQSNNNLNFTDTFEHRFNSIAFCGIYEHRINPWLMAGVKAGMNQLLSSKISKKGASSQDYILDSSQNVAPFINFSLSIAPVLK